MAVEYEYRKVSLPRGTTRQEARIVLTRLAETEKWELARLRLHPDGRRRIVLRRRTVPVRLTITGG